MFDRECPVCRTAEVISGKWTLLIIRDLADASLRFCELERSLEGISPRTLSLRLRALEEQGIVERRTFPEVPPRVTYQLTDKGTALVPLIEDMRSLRPSLAAGRRARARQRVLSSCKSAVTRRNAHASRANPVCVTTLESTTERLEEALRRLAVEAADLFEELLASGAEMPFDLEPTDDGPLPMYSYAPLTGQFIERHLAELRRLEAFVEVREIAGEEAAIGFMVGLWEGKTEFDIAGDRLQGAIDAVLSTIHSDSDEATPAGRGDRPAGRLPHARRRDRA